MHLARLGINTDMGLHAKVPLLAFLRLVHLLVAFPLPVLGRGRCGNQRGTHDRALPQEQAFLGQMRVDGVEDGFGQLMGFE